MPYIHKSQRERLANGDYPRTAGELNYLITQLCTTFIGRVAPSYTNYNEVIGVLECVKQEFYRRAMVPYEDKKIAENGDVYDG